MEASEQQTFDGLAAGYDAHRPRYPAVLFRSIGARCPDRAELRVVDVGAGTGIALEGLLAVVDTPVRATALDVSQDMVRVGRGKLPSVEWVCESAESWLESATALDLVLVAQAYQWLDRPRFLRACSGALAHGGVVAVMQNNRAYDSSDFLDAYERLLEARSPGYCRHYRDIDVAQELRDTFGPRADVQTEHAPWVRQMSVDDFTAMAASSTQVQRAVQAEGEGFLDRVRALADAQAAEGVVAVPYRSELFTAVAGRRGRRAAGSRSSGGR